MHARTALALAKLLDVQPEKPGRLGLCAHGHDERWRWRLGLEAQADPGFRSVSAAEVDFYLVRCVAEDDLFVRLDIGAEVCTEMPGETVGGADLREEAWRPFGFINVGGGSAAWKGEVLEGAGLGVAKG